MHWYCAFDRFSGRKFVIASSFKPASILRPAPPAQLVIAVDCEVRLGPSGSVDVQQNMSFVVYK